MVTSVAKNKLPLINVQHLDRERIAGQMNALAIARNMDAYGCNGSRFGMPDLHVNPIAILQE